ELGQQIHTCLGEVGVSPGVCPARSASENIGQPYGCRVHLIWDAAHVVQRVEKPGFLVEPGGNVLWVEDAHRTACAGDSDGVVHNVALIGGRHDWAGSVHDGRDDLAGGLTHTWAGNHQVEVFPGGVEPGYLASCDIPNPQ